MSTIEKAFSTERALDLALRSLKELVPDESDYAPAIQGQRKRQERAITAIKQTLAAPVQEPDHSDELTIAYMSGVHRGKELAAQRQWVGLSSADRGECLSAGDAHGWIGVMEATEAKLKEKNT